jgi:hypothetical protein
LQDEINNFLVNTPYAYPVIVIVIVLCLGSFLTSFWSGWFALSKRFKKLSEPYGETHSAGPFFYTVYTRFWSHYGYVIRMIAADDALYLSVLFPFRLGHPPLCIPWNEITLSQTKRFLRPHVAITYVVLTLGNQEKIPMRISEGMARKLGILDRLPS